MASGPKILYEESEHHNFLQKCFSSFNFSNSYRKCTLIERRNASFSVPKFVLPPLSHPLLKQEKAFKENVAVSKRNLLCSSILKFSPKEEVTAAPAQAAWWAASHLWQSTCPGSQAVAWKSGSPRLRVAHLAEQPNNLHILCISLGSWHASSKLHG